MLGKTWKQIVQKKKLLASICPKVSIKLIYIYISNYSKLGDRYILNLKGALFVSPQDSTTRNPLRTFPIAVLDRSERRLVLHWDQHHLPRQHCQCKLPLIQS